MTNGRVRTGRGVGSVGVIAGLAVVAVLACGGSDDPGHGMSGATAPAELVVDGEYSDERFIDMMAAHHQMAIEMASAEQQNGRRDELKAMAGAMIAAQQREIDELEAIKAQRFGTSVVATQMHEREMQNSGMMSVSQMSASDDIDRAFIDAMIPHHAGAIRMANVALQRSSIDALKAMARNIVDEQSEEIGRMIALRRQWYP